MATEEDVTGDKPSYLLITVADFDNIGIEADVIGRTEFGNITRGQMDIDAGRDGCRRRRHSLILQHFSHLSAGGCSLVFDAGKQISPTLQPTVRQLQERIVER